MQQKFTIKDVRRVEQEISNEISYLSNDRANDIQRNTQVDTTHALTYGTREIQSLQLKLFELIDMRFKIRTVVSDFNINRGINERTLKIAILEQKLQVLNNTIMSFGHVRTTRDYNSTVVQYIPGVDADFIDSKRAEGRDVTRQIQRLKDSCNGINSSTEVNIPEELIEQFKKYHLIDNQ